jgi:hypothetical protein
LAFWFNNVEFLAPLNELGMGHLIILMQEYFEPSINIIRADVGVSPASPLAWATPQHGATK